MGRIYDRWEKLVGKVFKKNDEYDYRPLASTSLGSECNSVSMFTLRELEKAAKNLKEDCLAEGTDFGNLYRGRLKRTNQVVAIILNQPPKEYDEQGNKEFLAQVSRFRLLHHPNITPLIGYCADTYQRQRLLVYEYMPLGSLKDNLHDLGPDKMPLDWKTRIEIATGVAKALEYLHDIANPPVLCQYLRSSTILLDENYHPKISGYGFPSRSSPFGCQVNLRNMEHCAPEFAMKGVFTSKSDVYSFGVVLLEIITGRKIIDKSRVKEERVLTKWAQTQFSDSRNFGQMADPMLQGQYPPKGLHHALNIAEMCLHEESSRPRIADVVTAMLYLPSLAEI